MSRTAIRAKQLYDHGNGKLTRSQVEAMYEAGKITEDERDWILEEGDDGDTAPQ